MKNFYSRSPFEFMRRFSREVNVGGVVIGGNHPIRVQSMTVADTLDTEGVVKEIRDLVEAGCEIVRVTAPTIHHAENLKNIKEKLRVEGVRVPLVADIHFTPQAAMIAAEYVDKVRINPGNYADRKLFAVREYSDSEYDSELVRIREKFVPLVHKCQERGIAIRIGTNHGSLSDRIMNRYGDTPVGMVESALEFARICAELDYHNLIFSMKASNTQVMVQAYRLLVQRMEEEKMYYPLHLGVTEAGDGEDGRIKSAIGICTLLEDGLGDTIRVSLTEDSIKEIPVAKKIVEKFNPRFSVSGNPRKKDESSVSSLSVVDVPWNPYEYCRRPSETIQLGNQYVGGKHLVRVQLSLDWQSDPQFISLLEEEITRLALDERNPEILSFKFKEEESLEPVEPFLLFANSFQKKFPKIALGVDLTEAPFLFPQLAPVVKKVSIAPSSEKNEEGYRAQAIEILRIAKQWKIALEWKVGEPNYPLFFKNLFRSSILLELFDWTMAEGIERFALAWSGNNWIYENRMLTTLLHQKSGEVVLHLSPPAYSGKDPEEFLLYYGGIVGPLLLDGIGDSLEIPIVDFSSENIQKVTSLAYNILQGARLRLSKTEFIACPSCGRTLFDLQTTTARIKKITSHLKGVKIAIMGCIVNGPGEMADADFGYVGGGPGRIHLYVGKECVEKNIPQEEADQKLVDLIKLHDRWVEPNYLLGSLDRKEVG